MVGVFRFRFAARKAAQAVRSLLEAYGGSCETPRILLACYLAERTCLHTIGRPLFGATYHAEDVGPVPAEIHELIRGDPLRLAQARLMVLPWNVSGYWIHAELSECPVRDAVAEAEWPILERAAEEARDLRLDGRDAATHGPDWQRARYGTVDYRDMVDPETPHRREILAWLEDPDSMYALF